MPVSSIACKDLACCQGATACAAEIRMPDANEAIKLMKEHVQAAHKVNYTEEQLKTAVK